MKNFRNLEKDTSSRMAVLQIKYIEKLSVSMVKVSFILLLCFQNMLQKSNTYK